VSLTSHEAGSHNEMQNDWTKPIIIDKHTSALVFGSAPVVSAAQHRHRLLLLNQRRHLQSVNENDN
jgi:hypothetical protein